MSADGTVVEGSLVDLVADLSDAWRLRQARKAAESTVATATALLETTRDDGVVTDAWGRTQGFSALLAARPDE